MVTRDVARVKSWLKSFFRSRGLSCAGVSLYKPEERARRARALPAATREAVELLGRELAQLEALKDEAETAMLRESHRHPIARTLETAPGLGPVRVAQMLPIVVTPHRFRTKRQFWAYCGFAVVTRSSSDWVRDQERWVKAPLKIALSMRLWLRPRVCVTRAPNPLRAAYDRQLANGTSPTWPSSRWRATSQPSCWPCGRRRKPTTRRESSSLASS